MGKKRRESCFFAHMRAALQNALTKTTGRTTLTSTTPTIGSGCGAASRRQSSSVCATTTTTGTSSSSPHRHHHPQEDTFSRDKRAMAKNWDGSGTQEDLMHRDECILVDSRDAITGYASKYDAHHFSTNTEGRNTPGLLH